MRYYRFAREVGGWHEPAELMPYGPRFTDPEAAAEAAQDRRGYQRAVIVRVDAAGHMMDPPPAGRVECPDCEGAGSELNDCANGRPHPAFSPCATCDGDGHVPEPTECRGCGEIEPCDERGVCRTCSRRVDAAADRDR